MLVVSYTLALKTVLKAQWEYYIQLNQSNGPIVVIGPKCYNWIKIYVYM